MKQPITSGQAKGHHSRLGFEHGEFLRPKRSSKRGAYFLIGGVVGGTLLVAVLASVFDDWSHLRRWFSGLAIVVIAAAYVFGKKWLLGRAMDLTRQKVDPVSHAGEREV